MVRSAPSKSKPKLHPAMQYARDVARKRIVAGKLVRLAVERHLRDLERCRAKNCPIYFDEQAALHAIDFFQFLKHSKGEWAGQGFELSPWQQFILWNLFGWKRNADGARRYRTAYIEIARKNGKSTFAAGIALYLLFADGEAGAEIYAAATKREQARIVHAEAVAMVKASPALRTRINHFKDNLHVETTRAKFEPLGADGESYDGFNVHAAIIDELHAHKTGAMLEVLETATGARRQPLIFIITTAGFDRTSVCWHQREYGRKLLEQAADEDDTYFAFVACIDEEDDWTDPKCWPKANPNLGVSAKLDDIARKVKKAIEIPAQQHDVRRKHLNEWVSQVNRCVPMDQWRKVDAIEVSADKLVGRPCLVGLDLAKSQDIAGYVLLFGDEEQGFDVVPRLWIPEARADLRERDNGIKYSVWERQNLIQFCAGETISYDDIRASLQADAKRFDLIELAYDPWNCLQFALELQEEGVEVIEFAQTIKNFNEPTRKMLELVQLQKLRHGGQEVLRWMADNLNVRTDPSGNIRPVKPEHASPLKIDGMVMLIMALGLYIRRANQGSSYDGSIFAV